MSLMSERLFTLLKPQWVIVPFLELDIIDQCQEQIVGAKYLDMGHLSLQRVVGI